MNYILLSILAFTLSTDPGKIGKINSIKSDARKAFTSGDYKKAIAKYKYLVDSLQVDEDEVLLNLASSYYLAKDTANAQTTYQAITNSEKSEVRSKAHQQLGVMADRKSKLEEALDHFKQAIKANPQNDDARYNYEMLKKKLEEKKKQEQDQQKKDQQNKDQKKDQNKDQKKDQEKKDQEKKDQENKDDKNKDDKNKDEKDKQKSDKEKKEEKDKKEQQEKEQQEQNKDQKKEKDELKNLNMDKLQQMQISEEKAKMILEAMKNQEKQYLQQNRRKATKQKDKSKPDW